MTLLGFELTTHHAVVFAVGFVTAWLCDVLDRVLVARRAQRRRREHPVDPVSCPHPITHRRYMFGKTSRWLECGACGRALVGYPINTAPGHRVNPNPPPPGPTPSVRTVSPPRSAPAPAPAWCCECGKTGTPARVCRFCRKDIAP